VCAPPQRAPHQHGRDETRPQTVYYQITCGGEITKKSILVRHKTVSYINFEIEFHHASDIKVEVSFLQQ
jgi:hypothetical protein